MKMIYLNGGEIADLADVHRIFAEALTFPEWYGNNFDALYDLLTECGEDTTVLLKNRAQLAAVLGEKLTVLQRVLHDAAEENPKLLIAQAWETEE